MFVVRFFLEVRAGLVHQLDQRCRLHFEFHLLVLDLAELQQLVHHAQHTLTVAVHDLQLTSYVRADPLVAQDVLYRSDDEGKRRTELMTDVGEEPQFDVRHLLLYLHFAAQTVVFAHDIDDQSDHGKHAADIQHPSPPSKPPRTLHNDRQRLLVVHFTAFAIRRANMEYIFAVP